MLALVGVLVSNSRSHAALEVNLDVLAAKVEKHSSTIELTYALEQEVAVLKHDVEAMGKVACGTRCRTARFHKQPLQALQRMLKYN